MQPPRQSGAKKPYRFDLKVLPGETVLDVACGNGVFSMRLAELLKLSSARTDAPSKQQ